MTHNQNSRKPLVTDLWLLVDEEQTMHFGMRQAWRWTEIEQPVRHRLISPSASLVPVSTDGVRAVAV